MSENFMDLSKLTVKDYSTLYLKRNPFPTSLIPDEIPPFTADRELEKAHFEDMLGDLIRDNKSSVTVFKGDYGAGKTHLLRAIKHSIDQQLFNFDNGVFPIYVRTPGRNILDFYQEVIEDVNRENLRMFAENVLLRYLEAYEDKIVRFVYDKEMKKNVRKEIEKDIGDFINGTMTKDLFRDIALKQFQNLKNYDVLFALLYLLHPSLSTYAWRWFLGTKLSKDELEYIDLKNNIDDTRTAYSVLKNLISILNTIGVKHIVLLIDELEKIATLSSNLRVTYQDDLRHLIDDFPSNMCMAFAITPFHWEKLSKEGTALVRRLSDNEFTLEFFNQKQVEDLIKQYLNFSRVENFPQKPEIMGCRSELYPFTDEVVEEIFALTSGVSNKVLRTCRKAIEYLVKNKQKTVSKKILEKILSS